MRSLMIGLCGSLPLMVGATSFTVDNADLVYVTGPGPVQVINGTEVYANVSENGSPWGALLSRAAGETTIVIEAEAEGTYDLQVWSVPSDPMHPQREQRSESFESGIGNKGGPFDVTDLLELLATWGSCSGAGACTYDLDDNGYIDVSDLLQLLDNWVEVD